MKQEAAMAKRIESTPKKDGYRMPGEFEEQEQVFMIWPQRQDSWRDGAKPAQKAYADIATAISEFAPVTMLVNPDQYVNARNRLPRDIRVVEMTSNDAWVRDCGPTFVKDDRGGLRAVDWDFNAWGGLYDGLYFPWDQDDMIAQKICDMERVDSYKPDNFILEGGSIHVDGEGTVLTTEMCLLSEGRNPHLSREEIEERLKEYLGAEKVIWIKDGIDPEETNGHVDDVACFVRPGEIITIWTDDESDPFYDVCHETYEFLQKQTDAKGRKFRIHRLCMPKTPVRMTGEEDIDYVEGTPPREAGEICIASYMNFLIVNGGVVVPQYDDEYDSLAIKQLQEIFPEKKVVGVRSREVVYGGGNIHCITQQMPKR